MVRRRNNNNQVRGPNSALSEFLRERGINAADIRRRANNEREAAAIAASAAAATTASDDAGDTMDLDAEDQATEDLGPPLPGPRTRRAINSTSQPIVAESSTAASASVAVKKTKAVRKRKPAKRKRDNDSDDGGNDEDWNERPKPVSAPGQIDFCAECEIRFTVTAYSRVHEDGLLCGTCSKKMVQEEKAAKRPRTVAKLRRRTKRDTMRVAMDGETTGALSLKEYCIRYIAQRIEEVDALGDMIGTSDMDRICRIISRNRSLNSKTLQLFFEPQGDRLNLYDCARIDEPGLLSIAKNITNLKHLSLYHAGQMTDEVLSYYGEVLTIVESIHIHGAFLITGNAYADFLVVAGGHLKSLTISFSANTDLSVVQKIVQCCPILESLSLPNLECFNVHCIDGIKRMKSPLQVLDISYPGRCDPDIIKLDAEEQKEDGTALTVTTAIIAALEFHGPTLGELNLAGYIDLQDPALEAIKIYAPSLRILNIDECENISDEALLDLFSLTGSRRGFVELHCGSIDKFSDQALCALVKHSGHCLEVLNINKCDQLTKRGLMALQDCKKLRKLDVGFVRTVDDEFVEKMQEIGVKNLSAWGCTKVTEACAVGPDVSMIGRESDIVA